MKLHPRLNEQLADALPAVNSAAAWMNLYTPTVTRPKNTTRTDAFWATRDFAWDGDLLIPA